MNPYRTLFVAGLLLGVLACKADDLLVGTNGGGDTQVSSGGAGGASVGSGGYVAVTGVGGGPPTSSGGSPGTMALGGATTVPTLGGAMVTFASGRAQGVMTGFGWIALGPLDVVTNPTCDSGTAITSAAPCVTQTNWNSPSALCASGRIPALPAVPNAADQINNWGIQIGVSANDLRGAIGFSFSSVTLYVTGAPSTGLRAELHRMGDPDAILYCAYLTSGISIATTTFNTSCWDGSGTTLTLADTPNIDRVAVQVPSSFAAINVSNLCLTSITFERGAGGSSGLCGNGTLDSTEQCDDGNQLSGDGCNAICQIEANFLCPSPGQPCQYQARCGNGLLTSDETCDDGNTVSGDGCSADCQTIEAGWVCLVPGKPCSPACNGGIVVAGGKCPNSTMSAVCGDGLVEVGEQCDSGSLNNDNLYGGCTTQCKLGPHCGDGVVQSGEQCDLGAANGNMSLGPGACTIGCMIPHYCGDGIVDTNLGELCDLGANNGQPGQPCDSACQHFTF